MKALLICPAERQEVAALAEHFPLALLSVMGKPLIIYWLEHLADAGFKEVRILSADRPDQVRAAVGTGARWGMEVEVIPTLRELTAAEARAKYLGKDDATKAHQHDVVVLDHFPELPNLSLFKSYSGLMQAVQAWLPKSALLHRVGVREVQSGVWIGLRSRISSSAKLQSPCWIGENVWVGANAKVGPGAILENRVVVESGVEISGSLIGPETLIGAFTEVKESIADGSTLINCRTNSHTVVPDAFLMCSLAARKQRQNVGNFFGRVVAGLLMLATAPIAALFVLTAKVRNQPSLRELRAVRPKVGNAPALGEMVRYYELANCKSWFRSWPQLLNIVRGDFAWVGNRPLSPAEVAQLESEFDRLWLAAPIGLISLADAEGVAGAFTDDARACASFYAVRANWRLDLSILARTIFS